MGRGTIFGAGLLGAGLLFACTARADQEASNRPHVVASQHGNCYAKAIPAAPSGDAGSTEIYITGQDTDQLVHRFDWFSQRILLECNVSAPGRAAAVSVIRIGPWPRGEVARPTDLAFAVYWNGQLMRQYSTLDIAGRATNVERSVSHYQVVRSVDGIRWIDSNRYRFAITTIDGRKLAFDGATGEPAVP